MIKSISLGLTVALFSTIAAAAIPVGTYTLQSQHQVKADGTVVDRELRQTITSVSQDGTTATLVSQIVGSDKGYETPNLTIGYGSGQIMSVEIATAVVADCSNYGGKLETITVKAGTFDTCRIDMDDDQSKGTIWIGAVPLGWVKQSIFFKPSGNQNEFELEEFGVSTPQ